MVRVAHTCGPNLKNFVIISMELRKIKSSWTTQRRKNPYSQLTIIPRTYVGYQLLDSGRGVEHWVGYHKLIFNKREWNNSLIKYQTLDKNISNFIFYQFEFSAISREKVSMIKLSVSISRQTTGYRISTVSIEPIRLPEIQYSVFGI